MVELTQLSDGSPILPTDQLIVLRANANQLLATTVAQLETLPGFQPVSAVAFATALARIMVLEGEIAAATAAATPTAQLLPLVCSVPGSLTAAMPLFTVPIGEALTLPANLAGTKGYARTAATASVAFTLSYVRGATQTTIGVIAFAAGATGVTLPTSTAALNLLVGDVLLLDGPSAADATLANFGVVFLATKTA